MNYRVRDAAGESALSISLLTDGDGGWKHFEWSVGATAPVPARARREGDEVVIETRTARFRAFVGPVRGSPGAVEVALGPETFAFHVLRGAGSPAGAAGSGAAGPLPVSTPMPGRVQAVHVEAGQAVSRGQLLVTLEAMKMQNEFLAPADGRVAEVRVQPGAVAAAGDVLVILEPAHRP